MKGKTKPKGFEMAATVLLAALLITVAMATPNHTETTASQVLDTAITTKTTYSYITRGTTKVTIT